MVLSLSKHEAAPYCEPPLLTGGEKRAISDMPSHSARRSETVEKFYCFLRLPFTTKIAPPEQFLNVAHPARCSRLEEETCRR
jgi:hypothetical protein